MKQQTKVITVAAAAAVLSLGASMSSFAATGWTEENGVWYYYDKDGVKEDDVWKKSGNSWYWLDGEDGGAMATDKLIDDGDNTYYVDANGVMVTNTWVKVVNEEQDSTDDPAEYHYYYMQSNGRAYKAGGSGTKFKTIDGKRYAFDEDGKMLYGWVKKDDASLQTGDSDWEDSEYYFGSWDDGALKTGWQKVNVYDQEEDENLDYWFYFKSNGQKQANDSTDKDIYEKKVNGRYYGFDQRGVMVYEWALSTLSTAASTSNWRYFNSPEDGARATRGWFKVVAPDENGNDNTYRDYTGTASSNGNSTFAQGDASDETERWYYADKDGQLYAGEIKKISGKYYGFAPEGSDKAGSMLSGLCALTVRNNGEIEKLWVRDMSYDDLQDCMDGVGDFAGFGDDPADALYYFGNNEDSDGAMKTGAVTINLDGDNYQFQFSKSGGAEGRGRGLNGIDSGKYIYKFGQKMKADTDEKYKVIYADADTGSSNASVHQIDSLALRSGAAIADQKNKDGDTIRYFGTLDSNYYLVNTSGSIVKNKTAAKDGDDWYFYVDNNQIKMYVNNKTLTASDGDITDGTHVLKDEWDTAGVEIANGYTGEPDNSMID